MYRQGIAITIGGAAPTPTLRPGLDLSADTANRSLFLVHPPQQGLLEGFSNGLVALANHIHAELPHLPVRLLDLGLADTQEIAHQVRRHAATTSGTCFVGITSTTATYQAALRVAETFKALLPGCVVIMGGAHAAAQDDIVLRSHATAVDLVIRGEGELALVALLRHYPNLSAVPNLSYLQDLEVVRTPKAPLLEQQELDRIAVTFRGWGLQSAPSKFDRTTYVSARGCPLRCSFCSVANEQIRNKSVEAVIRDLRILVGEMGYESIAIEDNFFAHSPKRTLELCHAIEALQRETPFRWDCQTRVESCQREDVLRAMETAGCEAVYLGVESFDPEHLLYLNKTRNPGSYLNILRHRVVPWLLQSSVDCYINLQLGLPAEGPSHRENTLHLLRELGEQAVAHDRLITIFPQLHVVYPGTRHFHDAVFESRFGPDSENVFEEFTRWEARNEPILRWLGEHFAHGTGGIPEGILHTDRLRRGEFEIDSAAVLEVVNYLGAMTKIPGISVFKYGRYLSGRTEHSVPSAAVEVAP